MKIKVCGIRRNEDVAIVNEYKPDYIGFVFAPTWRQIDVPKAVSLRRELRDDIKTVGVFVNQPVELLATAVCSGAVDYLQLHGTEDASYEAALCKCLQEKGIRNPEEHLIRAYRIRSAEDFDRIGTTRSPLLLLDAYSPKDIGGTGEAFDWTMIRNVNKPFFLAGGINANNVQKAINMVHPFGIDASSSLETDKAKDREKIKMFIERIRSYE